MIQDHQHLSYEEVSALVDGELIPRDAHDLEQHLASCHSCALSVISAMQLKSATKRAFKRFAPPPEVLTRFRARLLPETPKNPARVYTARSLIRGALAACLLLALSLLIRREVRQSSGLAAELLDQHLALLSSDSPPEVISSDRHTVKPWFDGKLPFSFNLPDAFPSGTTLKGGDLIFLDGHPAALLVFTVGRHQASVFLTQRSFAGTPSVARRTLSGFTIQYAKTQDLYLTVVSDGNPSDLALLVSALVAEQSPR